MTLSYKTKYALFVQPRNYTLGRLPRNENYGTQKLLFRAVLFVGPKTGKNRIAFKETVTSTPGILLSNKKEQTVDTHKNFYASQGDYVGGKGGVSLKRLHII